MADCLQGKKIAFIGAGSITEALLKGISKTGVAKAEQIFIANRERFGRLDMLADAYGVTPCRRIEEAATDADIIFLCTKPIDLETGLSVAARHAPASALYISVVAGCSTDWITEIILRRQAHPLRKHGDGPHVIRTMPNTSCAVLESATAYALGANCNEEDERIAHTLLAAVGTTRRLQESQLNAVTGLSGSGPAYVYYLVEALTRAGQDVGLDEETAVALVTQTIIGAAAMLKATDDTPAVLRKRVTSPGGTTMAGIAVLEQSGFDAAIRSAVKQATLRAEEMGNAFQFH